MSLTISRIFRCDRCKCEVRQDYAHYAVLPLECPPKDWTAIRLKGVLQMHICPECWGRLYIDPEHPGVFMWAEPATSTLPSGPLTPLPNLPKISETPHTPTTHGCERFVVSKAADDTGDA